MRIVYAQIVSSFGSVLVETEEVDFGLPLGPPRHGAPMGPPWGPQKGKTLFSTTTCPIAPKLLFQGRIVYAQMVLTFGSVSSEIAKVHFSPLGGPKGTPMGTPRGKHFVLNNHSSDCSQTFTLDAHRYYPDGINFVERLC